MSTSGVWLGQLLDAVVAEKAALDAAFTGLGLKALAHLATTPPDEATRRPYGQVELSGERSDEPPRNGVQVERVPVVVTLHIDGVQATALNHEGVAKRVLAGALTRLRAAVSDASVSDWYLTGGSLEADPERRNATRGAWLVTLRYSALVQW